MKKRNNPNKTEEKYVQKIKNYAPCTGRTGHVTKSYQKEIGKKKKKFRGTSTQSVPNQK